MPKAARLSIASTSVKPAFWARSARIRPTRSVRNSAKATLLWIDDFKTGLEMYSVMFEQLGYRVLTASSGEEGLSIAAKRHVDLVVTDYEMPGMTGEAVAASLKALHPDLPIVLFSGSTTVPFRALQVVDAYCDKAGSREELLAAIHFLLQKKRPAFLQPPPVAQASDDRQRTVA
jgi:CheY-like chemotaxis protein